MYTLSKGPSKIVASARRGPHRTLDFEGYDTREKKSVKSVTVSSAEGGLEDQSSEMSSPSPKPTFNRRYANMKKPVVPTNSDQSSQENHFEMTSLLSRQWKKVQEGTRLRKDGEPQYEVYREKEPTQLENFQPFDLEKFWGNRTLNTALGKPS